MSNSRGWWQSCSGCTDGVDGYVDPKLYPPHPKHGVQTGGGCSECKGRGVVFFPFTKADEEWCAQEARKSALHVRS